MPKVNDLIEKVEIPFYKVEYKGKRHYARNKWNAVGWVAKQIILGIVYAPGKLTDKFEDYDYVKRQTILILQTRSIEDAEKYVQNYYDNDYCPMTDEDRAEIRYAGNWHTP